MTEDQTSLQEYSSHGSRQALDDLIRRYLDMVYSSALRQVRDPHLAEDVTQAVFLILTQKAPTIRAGMAVGGWLLAVTRRACVDAMRRRATDRRHERAIARPEMSPSEQASWDQIKPDLDQALNNLSDRDRDAVVLRYFQHRTLAQVGAELGITPEAAAKRIERALARLRDLLGRSGSTATLGAAITSRAIHAAPAHLLAAAMAPNVSTSVAAIVKGAMKIMALTRIKSAAAMVAAIVVLLGGGAIILTRATAQPQAGNPPASQPAQEANSPADAAPRQLALSLSQNVNVNFVRIPAGKFLMGSPLGEKDRDPGEIQHEVTISKPFYMGITPVTVDQWAAFVAETGHQNPDERGVLVDHRRQPPALPGTTWRSPGFDQTGDHPVVQVSYTDCTEFCTWLSNKSGKRVTLPTEAQWEYAARAGVTTAYPWGDNPADGKGWANVSQKFFDWDDGFVYTSPVGSFRPNAFGLYDMTGNVRQWCFDRFAEYTNAPATDPAGAIRGIRWVTRGGTFESDPASTRLAYRLYDPNPDRHFAALGFRIAIAAD